MADLTLKELIEPIVRELLATERSGTTLISQRNCEATLGLSRRTHLELCRRPDFTPKVNRVGKLRLVDAHEYRTWLLSRDTQHGEQHDEVEMDGASQVLAELGLRELPKASVDTSLAPRTKRVTARSLR